MEGFLTFQETARQFEACRLYTRTYARSFYFASHVLPKEKRNAAYALYAFCRYADNLVDDNVGVEQTSWRLDRLNELRDQVRYTYRHSSLMHPSLLALRDTVDRYHIPMELFLDLLRGVEMDLTISSYTDYPSLLEYCYCVASVVGLMMMRVLGARDDRSAQSAVDLGYAMQLTNILRDVGEDQLRGRVYLPQDELLRFGVTQADLDAGTVSPNFVAFMRHQISRARSLYASGEAGIPALDNDGSRYCVRLMSGTYRHILTVIEKNRFDVFSRRAVVSAPMKFAIGARSLVTSFGAPGIAGNVGRERPPVLTASTTFPLTAD